MNIKNRLVVAKGEDDNRGMDWESGRCKQESLSVQHRELYSISCDKPQWRGIFKKNAYMCITESLCYTAGWHNVVNQL